VGIGVHDAPPENDAEPERSREVVALEGSDAAPRFVRFYYDRMPRCQTVPGVRPLRLGGRTQRIVFTLTHRMISAVIRGVGTRSSHHIDISAVFGNALPAVDGYNFLPVRMSVSGTYTGLNAPLSIQLCNAEAGARGAASGRGWFVSNTCIEESPTPVSALTLLPETTEHFDDLVLMTASLDSNQLLFSNVPLANFAALQGAGSQFRLNVASDGGERVSDLTSTSDLLVAMEAVNTQLTPDNGEFKCSDARLSAMASRILQSVNRPSYLLNVEKLRWQVAVPSALQLSAALEHKRSQIALRVTVEGYALA
jgi:hypothetical protein